MSSLSAFVGLRNIILATFQIFAFSHRLGQERHRGSRLPAENVRYPPKATIRTKGPIALLRAIKRHRAMQISALPSGRSTAGQRDAYNCVGWQRCGHRVMPGRCSGVFATWHIEGHQLPAFDAERFQWHCDRAPEPAPEPTVTDDKLNLTGRGAHNLPDIAKRRGVKVEHRQTNEIANSAPVAESASDSARSWHWML